MEAAIEICTVCGRPKDVRHARPQHVRLGADEVAEVRACECPKPETIIESVYTKATRLVPMIENVVAPTVTHAAKIIATGVDIRPDTQLNAVVCEVKGAQLNGIMSICRPMGAPRVVRVRSSMAVCMRAGMCLPMRLTTEGDGPVSATVTMATWVPFPGLTFASTSTFEVMDTHLAWTVDMPARVLDFVCAIEGVRVRVCIPDGTGTNAAVGTVRITGAGMGTDGMVDRGVLMQMVMAMGPPAIMAPHVDREVVRRARACDHVVTDVATATSIDGSRYAKIDGVKVMVLAYPTFAVVCGVASTLPAMAFRTSMHLGAPVDMDRPTIMVAEMVANGDLVLIGTVCVDGEAKALTIEDPGKYAGMLTLPHMHVRTSIDATLPASEPVPAFPNDGVVVVTPLATYRIKAPTVDLIVKAIGETHMLCARDEGEDVPIAAAPPTMESEAVYEFDIAKEGVDAFRLTKARRRISKRMPNSMAQVLAALKVVDAGAVDSFVSASITVVSMHVRAQMYAMAKRLSGMGRLIVTVGAGRFQEARHMDMKAFRYIAVDPDLDTNPVTSVSVDEFDSMRPFVPQVEGFIRRKRGVLAVRMPVSSFMTVEVLDALRKHKAVFVFSFSASYCLPTIRKLRCVRVPVLASCYVNSFACRCSLVCGDVCISVEGSQVRFRVGKAEWVEPVVSEEMVAGFKALSECMPELWATVPDPVREVVKHMRLLC